MNDFTVARIHFTPDLVTCKVNINEDIKGWLHNVENATSLKKVLFFFDIFAEALLAADGMKIKSFTRQSQQAVHTQLLHQQGC